MTPAQQTALEALAGRPMTAAEVSLASSRADGALATSLSVGRTVQGRVITSVLAAWLSETKLRATIEDLSKNITSPYRSGGLTILDLLSRESAGIDFSSSVMGQGNLAMLAAWVAAGIMTQAQSNSLIALAATPSAIDCNTVSSILGGN